ncbi:MAG: carbamoyl-phosphate synthase large subunit [Candidatus Latescibacterota bacterium]
MPKRKDLKKILIIGSGPIIIGQACEFDYSGTQACKSLRQEGFEVVLVNSNPATIMTDPETADRTYIEPITPEVVKKVIQIERPQALLPTLGGQTALNVAVALSKKGVLEKYDVELIGAKLEAIEKAEDRILFGQAMEKIGLSMPKSKPAYSVEEAVQFAQEIGFPIVVRPAYTLAGTGGGIAYNIEELQSIAASGIDASMIGQVLIEESVIGWKEYELEVMRDLKDNVVIICSIENFDPMGIHTGDSITVAPAQTLSDKEYQVMRDAAIAVIREIGVETGGSNIQFAINPQDGRMTVIEMNPRVSRSSALASKATGYPIAKIAAKLAVGYTLDEIPNDITRETPASFEPTIDYVVVKFPRWTFEKFPQANRVLTTRMKSVGEAMAIGRTFKEALQKAIRSMEIGRFGLTEPKRDAHALGEDAFREALTIPDSERIFAIYRAMAAGIGLDKIGRWTQIDPWFLVQLKQILDLETELSAHSLSSLSKELLRKAKEYGFSDRTLAQLLSSNEETVRAWRKREGILPTFKMVDTCAAEFEAVTPYYYSTYESEDEVKPSDRDKVMILGSGPNRIGQGIEFDYACVHAAFALRDEGFETIMVNSNPETVSTDYDTSDRLYFEPLTAEDVLNIYEREKPIGVIVQFGGQTPLNLAKTLEKNGVKILGTSPESIDIAEDRERFKAILEQHAIPQPQSGIARSSEDALGIARELGYPLMVRPSYVLGGRAMEVVYDEESLKSYVDRAVDVSPEHPILIDRFLERAIEIEVDAICDGEDVFIGGIMEHIEEAGVHSGDSACVLPPHSLSQEAIATIIDYTKKMALAMNVIGLINVQYALHDHTVYVLEVNPRASRTAPFVSKATGIPLAKVATQIIVGKKLRDLDLPEECNLTHISVKEAVFPFSKFPEVDPVLGPEMRATGEVMGIADTFGMAYYKAQEAANACLPVEGRVLITVSDKHQPAVLDCARMFMELKFEIIATGGTHRFLKEHGIPSQRILKLHEGRPNIVDAIKNGTIHLVINTPAGKWGAHDDAYIRKTAIRYGVPYITTTAAATAAASGIAAAKGNESTVCAIQDYHARIGISAVS